MSDEEVEPTWDLVQLKLPHTVQFSRRTPVAEELHGVDFPLQQMPWICYEQVVNHPPDLRRGNLKLECSE